MLNQTLCSSPGQPVITVDDDIGVPAHACATLHHSPETPIAHTHAHTPTQAAGPCAVGLAPPPPGPGGGGRGRRGLLRAVFGVRGWCFRLLSFFLGGVVGVITAVSLPCHDGPFRFVSFRCADALSTHVYMHHRETPSTAFSSAFFPCLPLPSPSPSPSRFSVGARPPIDAWVQRCLLVWEEGGARELVEAVHPLATDVGRCVR